MSLKLGKYWDEHRSTFHEAVILDSNNKLLSFESDITKHNACDTVCTIYKTYYKSRDESV